MSAIGAITEGDHVHVFADGAFYDSDTGRLTAIGTKIHKVPGVNAVFASRGVAFHYVAFLAAAEGEWESFDHFRDYLPDVWEKFDALAGGHLGEILIAGWSEELDEPQVVFRCTHDIHSLTPGVTYLMPQRCGFSLDLPPVFDAPLVIDAFENARLRVDDLHAIHSEEPVFAHSVGGHIQHVEVGRNGVETDELLHEWPDVVGEKIRPRHVMGAVTA